MPVGARVLTGIVLPIIACGEQAQEECIAASGGAEIGIQVWKMQLLLSPLAPHVLVSV